MVDPTDVVKKDIVPALNATELVAGMAMKPVSEKILSPVVGNGTFISGFAKMLAAITAQRMVKGTVGNVAAVALGSDGAEDMVLALGGLGGLSGAGTVEGGVF
jgi:hypothetical protein